VKHLPHSAVWKRGLSLSPQRDSPFFQKGAASKLSLGNHGAFSAEERSVRSFRDSKMQVSTVNTRLVANRRPVHLRTIHDLVAEVDRVTSAVVAGKVRQLGNWSPAQVLWHIGRLIELSFDGFPFRYRRAPTWITRMFRLLAWRWLIALAFRPGFKNPPEAAVLEPDPSVSLDDAVAYLNQQVARIRNGERMTQECSVEGPYGHGEWVYIHLRHAELHLSFLTVERG
jgi:hypothetical protein